MSIAQFLEGANLPGNKIPGIWAVVEKMIGPSQASGPNFSVGYRVRHSDGRDAFMKASDMNLATTGNDLLAQLTALSEMQKFERAILDCCRGNNMDRIVTPLDYGDEMRIHQNIKEPLFWIIFELAECDSRVQINRYAKFDLCWGLNAMHNLATAVKQLHSATVTHNDIRPSNLLVFDELLQKLGDLGSAVSPEFPTFRDGNICLGDPRYAALEILYNSGDDFERSTADFQRRRASDLYLLGSMGYFFVTGNMITPEILSHLLPAHRPHHKGSGWSGDFEGVLPYLRDGYTKALQNLKRELPRTAAGELNVVGQKYFTAISELCEPDPALRGHPQNRLGKNDPYSVEKYISLFDVLRRASLN